MASQVYSISLNYNSGGQFAANIFHYQFDDAGFTTTAQAAAALLTAWTTANFANLRAILPTAVTILSSKGRRVTNSGGFEGSDVYSSSNTGTRTGTMKAAGIGPVIIWYGIGNSKLRGRTFVPGVTDTDCMDGILQSGIRTALNTFEGTMLAPIVLSGGGAPTATFGLFSRASSIFTPISQAMTSDMVGQVRRRQLPV